MNQHLSVSILTVACCIDPGRDVAVGGRGVAALRWGPACMLATAGAGAAVLALSSGDSSLVLTGTIGSEKVTAEFPYANFLDNPEFPGFPNVQGQHVVTTATLTVTQG